MHAESPPESSALPDHPQVVATVHQPADLTSLDSLPLAEHCDFLEFRLDTLIPGLDGLESIMKGLPVHSIITARHPDEGGSGNLSAAARLSLIRRFMGGANAIDIELRSVDEFGPAIVDEIKAGRKRLVLSFHDFEGTPAKEILRSKIGAAVAANADVVKIATALRDTDDLFTLVEVLREEDRIPVSIMGMGRLGKVSRLLLAQCGSVLNYGFLNMPNAPGQWPAIQLKEMLEEK